MMPPPWVRRPLTVTVWLLFSSICLTLSPLWRALGAIANGLTRRPQPAILAQLTVTYFARELAAMIGCGGLWLASGAGARIETERFQLLHWRLLRRFVHGIAEPVRSLLQLELQHDGSPDAASALEADGPLIVLSRHAGPGDTLLLIDRLLADFGRKPSVVLKQALALDPSIDLFAHRLPHVVLDPADRDGGEAEIETVCSQLDRRGVLVLFPEGGNFTPERRRRALRSLRQKGERRAVAKAERMAHVLPPRPSGVQAALRGSPRAPVIFAAHTGLGLAAYPRELGRHTPIGETLHTRMWLVPAGEIPSDPEGQVAWLNDWWARIDRWIDERRTEPRFS